MCSSKKGEESFVIKFELLSADEIQFIWETTERYVFRQRKNREEQEVLKMEMD